MDKKFGTHQLIILDMDLTLVVPREASFYENFGLKTVEAISQYFDVSYQKALQVAKFYRERFGGAEQSLFRGDVDSYFPDIQKKPPNYKFLYNKLAEINVANAFINQSCSRGLIEGIRANGVRIVVLTSSPDDLAKRVLSESGFDPDVDFDSLYTYQEDTGPPKIVLGGRIFEAIIDSFGLHPSQVLSIGDHLVYDIIPALRLGADGCLISDVPVPGYYSASSLEEILNKISAKTPRIGYGFNY